MMLRQFFSISILALMSLHVFAWPWSTDMMNQPSIKPQEGVMPDFPQRSVPVQGFPTKVKNREEALNLKSPIEVSQKSLRTGKQLFRVYCAACHGLYGKADKDSPVSGKIGAISLVDDYVQKQLTEGHIWGTITFGSAVMPAYGLPSGREDRRGSNDLDVDERWHVVNYVKHKLAADAAESAAQVATQQQAQQH